MVIITLCVVPWRADFSGSTTFLPPDSMTRHHFDVSFRVHRIATELVGIMELSLRIQHTHTPKQNHDQGINCDNIGFSCPEQLHKALQVLRHFDQSKCTKAGSGAGLAIETAGSNWKAFVCMPPGSQPKPLES